MPTLRAIAFNDSTQTPILWICSDCDVIYALERMRPPTVTELRRINSNFQVHCSEAHPDSAVIELTAPS